MGYSHPASSRLPKGHSILVGTRKPYTVKNEASDMQSINRLESNVRGYCRSFPAVFKSAVNARVTAENGREYIDFFAGAGTLNYGHNNPKVKAALIEYLSSDGLMHGLDLATTAKIAFLESFETIILKPRGLDYKVQFTGPTGANAVEAAIKLARKVKQRSHIISFTNGYHGHSLGALALTGNQYYHDEHYGSRQNVTFHPFDNYYGDGANTAMQLRTLLEDNSSGVPIPAAIILETIQAEGGVNVASDQWLKDIKKLCDDHDIALIVDDIQSGNGRTGDFFSFEQSGVIPDMVCVSKSIGGGLPLSLVLIKPSLDEWQPGHHTGTFRGNQLAFVAANELLKNWQDDDFAKTLKANCHAAESELKALANQFDGMTMRGRGMLRGLVLPSGELADAVTQRCFNEGLIMETAGAEGQVLKFLAPLTIDNDTLQEGLGILKSSLEMIYDTRYNHKNSGTG